MDVKYQVFISSTFQDLEDERRIVMEQILNLGHIPVGMELFQAGNDNQWAHIKRRIVDCDYYLVIVAERYGSEESGKSYTQLEYEWAVEQGIPVAAFLLDSTARPDWPAKDVEHDKRDKVEAFRALCQTKLVKFWSNGDQLGARVTTALVEMFREQPQPGWVRGNTASSAAALEEIARLSDEKRKLQADLAEYKSTAALIPTADVKHRLNAMATKRLSFYLGELPPEDDLSLLDAFVGMSRVLASQCSVYDISHRLEEMGIRGSREKGLSMKALIAELAATNLISASFIQSGSDGTTRSTKVYSLTEYGKQFLMFAEMGATYPSE